MSIKLNQQILSRAQSSPWHANPLWAQIVVNDDALAVLSPGFLVEYHCRFMIRKGYGLPLKQPKHVSIVAVDPAGIVFPCTVFLAGDRIESGIQIDMERGARFAPYGDRCQDAPGIAPLRTQHVEHAQDCILALERDDAAAARVETDTLLFIADLQQESLPEVGLFQGGWLHRHCLGTGTKSRDKEPGGE